MYEVDNDDDDRNCEHTGRKKGTKNSTYFSFCCLRRKPSNVFNCIAARSGKNSTSENASSHSSTTMTT